MEAAYLSSVPTDGSEYRIRLEGEHLHVARADGTELYSGDTCAEYSYYREELLRRLEEKAISAEATVPEYDGLRMTIRRYYEEEKAEKIPCSLYFLDGEPLWFVEGDDLRFYKVVPYAVAAETSDTAKAEPGAESDPLDKAISAAILTRHRADLPYGQILTESHVILDTYTISGTPKAGEPEHVLTDTVFVLLMAQPFIVADGLQPAEGGVFWPAVLTFQSDADGVYTMKGYREPLGTDETTLQAFVRENFIKESAQKEALAYESYHLPLMQACYASAIAYTDIEPEAWAAQLIDKLTAAHKNNTAESLAETEKTVYNTLLYLGDYTLGYIFGEFLAGGQTDLRGEWMQRVMCALLGDEVIAYDAANGQEYFDAWLTSARAMYKSYGEEHMREHAPYAWILLTAAGEASDEIR